MKIRYVDLKDVKSYEDAHIIFADGTNAICGQNGAGKSTILEAIGFVLFDYLQTAQGDFVRTGLKTATATIGVEKGGHEYEVTRSCSSTSKYAVFSDGTQITDGKAETLAWIHEFLSIPDNEELSSVFRDAVGVPQGLLTAAFLETPANRKRIFGPLLHVDDYETAWSKLRDVERIFEGKASELDTNIARLETEAAPLEDTRAELETLRLSSSTTHNELEKTKEDIISTVSELSKRDQQAGRIDGARNGMEITATRVAVARERATAAQAQKVSAQEAFDIAAATKGAYGDYIDAQKELEEEQKALARSTTAEALAEATHDTLQGLADRSTELGEQIRDADKALERVGELAPAVEAQEVHKDNLEQLLSKQRECDYKRADVDRAKTALDIAERALMNAGQFSVELFGLRETYENRKKSIAALEDTQDTLKEQGLAMKAEIEMLRLRIAALSANDTPTCPVCGTDLSVQHGADLLDSAEKRILFLVEEKETVSTDWASGASALRSLQSQMTQDDRRIAVLGEMPDQSHFSNEVTRLELEFNELQQEVDAYADIDQQIYNVRYVIKSLGDPVSEMAVCKAVAESKPKLLAGLETVRGEITEGEAKLRSLSATAALVEPTKIKVDAIRVRIEELRTPYELYIANQEKATSLADCTRIHQVAEAELQRHSDDLAHTERVLAEFEAAYNAEQHENLRAQMSQLLARQAVLLERSGTQDGQIAELEHKIVGLVLKSGLLDMERIAKGVLDMRMKDLQFLRQTIRDAGPEITKMLVASISITADRLFGDIIQDASASLEWTEDYDVVVTIDGQPRHFNQLSGGEQMSAALSVRLALLREISDIDFAFFDEPTVNLDAQRRENLAEQIMNVKGFSQLFVISHDDSFEQGTNNAVRIVKVNGVSAVS